MENSQAQTPSKEANGLLKHRVRFSSGTVKPLSLPTFAYVSTELLFDAIIYTAIVQARDTNKAKDQILEFWPDAVIRFIEVGQHAFLAEDQAIKSVYYGSYLARKNVGFFDRLRKWFKGLT